ncbi:putative receptor-like serine/threonine-protein kinase [Acorus calamus]|uniref:Receptor-like serine/threonine-protein kinase n=1 Tax=Acorus calamus TaxID=4465 RepID=A0AAV9EY96_ACOCL|nr:putative receptor-like serine/threonine-protein kinase [Acorus calamus]
MENNMSPVKILVGVSSNVEASERLLSWAVRVAARPDDTVIALHVIVCKDDKKFSSSVVEKTRLRHAKAYVISMLGEFSEVCQNRKVNLEAKIGWSSSVEKCLVDEAASLEASFLLISTSQSPLQRTSLEITKYCLRHAPDGCSVIVIGKQGSNHRYPNSESSVSRGFERRTKRQVQVGKSISSLQRLFIWKMKWENSSDKGDSLSSSHSQKNSPRAVLDGPEAEHVEEDLSSLEEGSCTAEKERETLYSNGNQQPLLRCFSYYEIAKATKNFHSDNMVGRGGYAEVYRGDLRSGQIIAVKRLAIGVADENKEREFLEELGVIGHVCHPNTASLIGFCIESGLHLIFEFSPNGTLASALHGRGSKALEWPTRYKIAVGIARGLHYLHKCCKRRIIHRDIKASNVLLGPDFEPQISDFGLAKWLPKQWTHHSIIPIEGTFGYLAPEYFMHGIVDEKTDVFAFGVLLLEIISGRRPVDSSKQSLLQWAKPLIECGDITKLVDQKLGDNYEVEQMQRLVLAASCCVRHSSIWRPSMNEVLELLSEGDESVVGRIWRMPDGLDDHFDAFSILDIDC